MDIKKNHTTQHNGLRPSLTFTVETPMHVRASVIRMNDFLYVRYG